MIMQGWHGGHPVMTGMTFGLWTLVKDPTPGPTLVHRGP